MLTEFNRWKKDHDLHVMCGQEHNWDPADYADLQRLAKSKKATLVASFAPPDARGRHSGGVFLLVSDECVSSQTF